MKTVAIVFFRNHVSTGEPITNQPQVWTYSTDYEIAHLAGSDLARLEADPDITVSGSTYTTERTGAN